MWRWRGVLLVLAAATAVACSSPEASRSRGGGPGADVGNHPRGDVQIHAGANMYYGTRTQGARIGERAFIGGTAEAAGRADR
jgi:hypothetical protein